MLGRRILIKIICKSNTKMKKTKIISKIYLIISEIISLLQTYILVQDAVKELLIVVPY